MRPSTKPITPFPKLHSHLTSFQLAICKYPQKKVIIPLELQIKAIVSMRLWLAAAVSLPISLGSAVVAVSLPHRCSCRRGSAGTGSISVRCKVGGGGEQGFRTCKNCKSQFDPATNHPSACKFHTAHFGGETKRKFESVYSGGTMNTPDSGKVYQYWHCCGSEDQFDPGCTSAPHASYDD